MSLLQARLPNPEHFTFLDKSGISIPINSETRVRVLDFQPVGTMMLDEDADGDADVNTHIYLQHHAYPNIVHNVEIHQRAPKCVF